MADAGLAGPHPASFASNRLFTDTDADYLLPAYEAPCVGGQHGQRPLSTREISTLKTWLPSNGLYVTPAAHRARGCPPRHTAPASQPRSCLLPEYPDRRVWSMLLGRRCGVVVAGAGTGGLQGCLDNQTPTSTSQVPSRGCLRTARDTWGSPSSHPALRGLSTPRPEQWGSCQLTVARGQKGSTAPGEWE